MTVNLPPAMKFQPLVGGSPIPNGKVRFYLAGTTTPTPVYDEGGIPIGVELDLDANGAADFRLDPTLSYKVALFDSQDVPVPGWPVNGVNSDNYLLAYLLDTSTPSRNAGAVAFDEGLIYPPGTVGGDLKLPRPVARGGTGSDDVAGALANLGIIDTASEVSINSSVAMDNSYLNKMVVCATAGAFYSPVLPPSAPVGSSIFIRIAQNMTFLVVLTAGGSDTIDGVTSRTMWSGESALLVKTSATEWTKIAGRTIPMSGSIIRTANQLITTGSTFVPVDFTTANSPGSRYCWDSANNRFRAGRAGTWYVKASIPINITNPTSIGNVDAGLCLSSGALTTQPNSFESYPLIVAAGAQRWVLKPSGIFQLASGGYVEAIVRAISTAANFNVESVTPTIDPSLSYQEIPTW